MSLICHTRITQVTVHARGALVHREALLPPAALTQAGDGELDLIIPDISLLADGGSVRAALRGGTRAVVSARTTLTVPDSVAPLTTSEAALRALEDRQAQLIDEHKLLSERRVSLLALSPDPELRSTGLPRPDHQHDRRAELQPDTRVADALAASALLSELCADLDARLGQMDQQLREVSEQIQAAQAARAQAPSRQHSPAAASQRIVVRIAGSGPAGALHLSYAVPAARWWPLYTLRLSEGGRRAVLLLEALVAQRSGEDWQGVRLALSTADLLADARLPELASLRLSRAQPPARRGYRPPPLGLERLFAGHDRVFGAPPPAPPPPAQASPFQEVDQLLEEAVDEDAAGVDGGFEGALQSMDMDLARRQVMKKPMAAMAPPPMAMSMSMPMLPQAAKGMARARGGISTGRALRETALGGGGAPGGFGGAAPSEPSPPPPPALEPDEGWQDFDALRLGPVSDPQHRGRLCRDSSGERQALRASAAAEIERLLPPLPLRDPRDSRGLFDHRYDAEGVLEVPSDGQAHRLVLRSAAAEPTLSYLTVPREAKEVYRQAELHNPLAGPLLAGPADVYMDGSLLTTTQVERVDRGGTLVVGMGVEERLRVARNARVEEESAGMLGGSVAVTHTVTIELVSSLGQPVTVTVADRVPLSSEKGVEIRRTQARPEPTIYKQEERGAPIQGGLRWQISLGAGERGQIEFQYRVTFPAKNEIIGGNRRE